MSDSVNRNDICFGLIRFDYNDDDDDDFSLMMITIITVIWQLFLKLAYSDDDDNYADEGDYG